MSVQLDWTDNNYGESEHRVYRDTSPLDTGSLPSPLATLDADVETYTDTSVSASTTYYYIVSAVCDGEEVFSSEVSVTTAVVIDPATLFLASEYGALFDFSDLSTLWTDTSGTTAVSSDGDLIARVDDKSGNGLDLHQPTAGYRPKYKTDGTLHWALGDGVDDFLYSVTVLASRLMEGGGLLMVASFSNTTGDITCTVNETQDGDAATSGDTADENIMYGLNHDARSGSDNVFRIATTTAQNINLVADSAVGTESKVFAANWNGTEWEIWIDGVKQTDTSTENGDFATRDNRRINLLRRLVSDKYANGGVYLALFHEDGQSDAMVIGLTNYFKSKAGL